MFQQLFRALPNFHECFCASIKARRTCFNFLKKIPRRKKESNLFTLIIKAKILMIKCELFRGLFSQKVYYVVS